MNNKIIQIAGCSLSGNLFLAPMAGFTDTPFRQICSQEGADLAFTEMVSAEALCRDNEKTLLLAASAPASAFHAIQLFGSKPDRCALACEKLLPFKPDIIDLNCGCPVPKVVKTGAGSALMKTPALIGEIVQAMRQHLDSCGAKHVGLTVKIRSGWDHESINYLEAIKSAEEGGASMVSIHSRTRSQGYSGEANWDVLSDAVKNTHLPVCGSGDLFSAADALRMFQQTDCAAAMFARGAVGNPWIFKQTKKLLDIQQQRGSFLSESEIKDLLVPIASEVILSTAWRHLKLASEMLGEKAAVREMKKHFCSYTKGVPLGKSFRNSLMQCQDVSDYRKAFYSYWPDGIDFE